MAHNSCPKCGTGIAGGGKTCGSCGAVRLQSFHTCARVKVSSLLTTAFTAEYQLKICALTDLPTVAITNKYASCKITYDMKEVAVSH